MNTLNMVLAAVASGNKQKEELNANHQKYLRIFQNENLENEYQSHVNAVHEKEMQMQMALSKKRILM